MKNGRDALEESLEGVEENGASRTRMRTKELLLCALDRVGAGKLGVDSASIRLPSYPGFFGLWDYARDVRKALLVSLDLVFVFVGALMAQVQRHGRYVGQ